MKRLWYRDMGDGKIRGVVALSDEQALDRLERGERWVPLEGMARLTEILTQELAA